MTQAAPRALLPLLVLAAACPARAQGNERTTTRCGDPFKGEPPRFSTSGWETNFCKHSVPYSEIRSGGPPRDGIPPIDAPRFVSPREAAAWLRGQEPVLVLEAGGDARVYPMQILIWHEIVNDTVGGTPVAVTFCPLCYAAIVFERPVVNGKLLTFGTSGNLRHSDLVMWDRQTESWWQQFEGVAIVGDLTGHRLRQLPAAILAWEEARRLHPRARVLSRETGHHRPYGKNPYAGYDDVRRKPFLYQGFVGDGLPPMAHVVGVRVGGGARAYPREILARRLAINDRVGGRDIVLLFKGGATSALDASRVAGGRDIGQAMVFDRRLGGRTLTFEPLPNGTFRDRETKSLWTFTGKAVKGRLTGSQLVALPHHEVFWFVWSAFVPESPLFQESGAKPAGSSGKSP